MQRVTLLSSHDRYLDIDDNVSGADRVSKFLYGLIYLKPCAQRVTCRRDMGSAPAISVFFVERLPFLGLRLSHLVKDYPLGYKKGGRIDEKR